MYEQQLAYANAEIEALKTENAKLRTALPNPDLLEMIAERVLMYKSAIDIKRELYKMADKINKVKPGP
jgi:cell division protein FtsB